MYHDLFYVYLEKEYCMSYFLKLFIKLFLLMFSTYILVSLLVNLFTDFKDWQDLLIIAVGFSFFMSLILAFIQKNALARYKDWHFGGSFIGGQYYKTVKSSIEPEELYIMLLLDDKRTYQLKKQIDQSLTFLTKGGWRITGDITTISWSQDEDGQLTYRITCRPRFFLNIIDYGTSLKHIEEIIRNIESKALSNQTQEA